MKMFLFMKERARLKTLLAHEEVNFSYLYNSLLTALKPVISINICQISLATLSQKALKLLNDNPELYNSIKINSNECEECNEDDI